LAAQGGGGQQGEVKMAKGPKPKPVVKRFWENVLMQDGCWAWRGQKNPDGYGQIHVRRRSEDFRTVLLAHRISWEIHKGPIPPGMFVCHHCDNPECANPEHLFLGTNRDNMIDCSMKGRQNGAAKSFPGSKNGCAILNEDIVRKIRKSKETPTILGNRYGVSRGLIWRIRTRKAWKHVD
jgi:hypothetical protein